MGSDKLFKKRTKARKIREQNTRKQRSETWLIVCEGEKTEPNYFEQAVKHINEKLNSEEHIKIKIVGSGFNTKSLVNSAISLQQIVDKHIRKASIPYGKTFVVFDKDDFSNDEFDNAVRMCEQESFIPLWSNEAFELWFLLHFNNIQTYIPRVDYSKKLNQYFKKKGLTYKYKKNDKDIYNKLINYGSIESARKYAYNNLCNNKDNPPSQSFSCTSVYKFFDAVDERLEELK